MKTDYPEDNATTIYLPSDEGFYLGAIMRIVKEKWPHADFSDILIETEHHHVACLRLSRLYCD